MLENIQSIFSKHKMYLVLLVSSIVYYIEYAVYRLWT